MRGAANDHLRPGARATPAHRSPCIHRPKEQAMTDLPTAHSDDSARRAGRNANRSWTKVALTGSLALAIGVLAACGTSSASGSAVAAPTGTAAAPSSGQGNPGGQGVQG